VGFVDGDAYEGVVLVDPDFGDVSGVVADGHGVPDEGSESRREIPLALEMDAVALHGSVFGNGQKEPVEFVQALRHPWQPTVSDPCVPG